MSYQPSYWDRMKMGLAMGGLVGGTMGFILGSGQVLFYGPGPNGYLRSVGASMLKSATFFGSLMAIGSLIRNQERNREYFYKDVIMKNKLIRDNTLNELLSYESKK